MCDPTFATYADCTMTAPWPLLLVGGLVAGCVGVVKGVGYLFKKLGEKFGL